jgi:hypothetical protein
MWIKLSLVVVWVMAVAGCQRICSPPLDGDAKPEGKQVWHASDLSQREIQAGIIRQHVVWPHYFYADSPEMNSLGRRDVEVLAAHFRQHSGELIIRRGDADRQLYRARIGMVRRMLAKAGVDTRRVKMVSGFAGGDGIASVQAAKDYNRDLKKEARSNGGSSEGYGLDSPTMQNGDK